MISSKSLRSEKVPRDNESIFLEQYSWLMERARHLAAGTSEDPQDLVQELYISFTRLKASAEFKDTAHVQAYLRKALRNLFTSRRMRHGKDVTTRLTLVDFDSLEFALTAVDRSQLLNVRSDLAKISEYILIRRSSSKGATAFIMRFFFGYLPTEITALLKMSRVSYEKQLLTTRLEAKAYVERPHVLRFLHRQPKNTPEFFDALPDQSDALFAELQRRMFHLPVGAHSVFGQMEETYATAGHTLSLEQTVHLGSCRSCLQRAGNILDIPDLLEQLFLEPTEPQDPTSSTGGINNARLKKLRRKGREAFEHRPTKLQIIVDGQVRGIQAITSAESRLQLTFKPRSHPEFVEVRSEQGVSMLYFDLEHGAELLEERQTRADFSEGRTLTASLRFADGAPTLEVCYWDPLRDDLEDDASVTSVSPDSPTNVELRPAKDRRSPLANIWTRLLGLVRRLSPLKIGATVGASLVLFAGALYLLRSFRHVASDTPKTAAEIVRDSLQNLHNAVPPGGGVHAIYSIKRQRADGKALETGAVEAIRSVTTKQSALRLIAPSGEVLAGRWTDLSGTSTNYASAREPLSLKARAGKSPIWTHVPDVEDFISLAGTEPLIASRTQSGYELEFKDDRLAADTRIEGGRIVLSGATLRPTSEDLELQEENTRTNYHFTAVSYRVLSRQDFALEDLAPLKTSSAEEKPMLGPRGNISLALHVLGVLASNEETENAIDLDRQEDGAIKLTGVLSSAEAKEMLIRKLRTLRLGETLLLDLHSYGEAPNEQPALREVNAPLTSVEISTEHVPLEHMLRAPSEGMNPSGSDQQTLIDKAARQLVANSAIFRRELWLATSISDRWFRPSELRSMSPDDQALWSSLIWRHLLASNAALGEICTTLHLPTSVPNQRTPANLADATAFDAEVERLLQNGDRLDRLLNTGFSLTAQGSRETPDGSEIASLAAVIQQQERVLIQTVASFPYHTYSVTSHSIL